jgi:hypothetical protein
MLRVLMADDQIPDKDIPDNQVVAEYRRRYPGKNNEGFVAAFGIMRKLVHTMSDGFSVDVANHHSDALNLVQMKHFDVAIIDLGWWVDRESLDSAMTAGWAIIDAIQRNDMEHPERRPTALIIYSARFETNADISEKAAQRGILPFYKPYGERHSIPLGDDEVPKKAPSRADQELAASKSLRAVVSFIEHLRGSSGSGQAERLLQAAHAGLRSAETRDKKWDRLTRVLMTLGILIIFAGVVALFLGQVQEGVVTAASGAVIALISKLLFGQLGKARAEMREAQRNFELALEKTRQLDGQHRPGVEQRGSPTTAQTPPSISERQDSDGGSG